MKKELINEKLQEKRDAEHEQQQSGIPPKKGQENDVQQRKTERMAEVNRMKPHERGKDEPQR